MVEQPIVLDEFSFSLDDQVINIDLNKYVPIDPNNLIHEFATQPAAYAYLATLSAQIEAEYSDAKRSTERVYAETDSLVRSTIAARNEKLTEAGVKAMIEQSDNYRAAVDNETYTRSQYLVLRAIVAAMEQRAQMLISLGAHMRMEADMTGMSVKSLKDTLDGLKKPVRA